MKDKEATEALLSFYVELNELRRDISKISTQLFGVAQDTYRQIKDRERAKEEP
jgi:hypothetical protein